MLFREFFHQETDEGLGRRRPGETTGLVVVAVPLLIGLEKLIDGFPDCVGIIGVEVSGSIATDLMQYGNIGHQYGASATHRLDGGQAESLVERRENEADGLIV